MMLPCFLAFSQGAESLGNKPELTVVARAEYSSIPDTYHLGNSSVYFLVDGTFSERFSYGASLHLLCADPKMLYQNTLRSDSVNWLDWAWLSYDFGKCQFLLGKDYIKVGTWEAEEYDFDCYFETASTWWMMLPVYQWGASFTWSPSETFFLTGQVTTSPYGEKPFASGRYTFSLEASTTALDWYNGIYSVNYINEAIFAMGHKFMTGNWEFIWDSLTEFRQGYHGFNTLSASFLPSEKWSLMARASYENDVLPDYVEELMPNRFAGSFMANWKPLEQLRVHALAAYDFTLKSPSFNIGLTWKMSL